MGRNPHDYYEHAVTLRLAARRAIPHSLDARRVERDVGAASAPLSRVMPDRPPRGRFGRPDISRPIAVASPLDAVARDECLHHWRLRFKQCGLHHIARVSRGVPVSAFRAPALRRHAAVPLDFRPRVSR